jgi:hypothetical protein
MEVVEAEQRSLRGNHLWVVVNIAGFASRAEAQKATLKVLGALEK